MLSILPRVWKECENGDWHCPDGDIFAMEPTPDDIAVGIGTEYYAYVFMPYEIESVPFMFDTPQQAMKYIDENYPVSL